MTPAQKVLAHKEFRKNLHVAARENFAAFTLATHSGYKMNWHHKLICDKLEQVVAGKIKRLMVFMPPRHGKSELVSIKFPAYVFGRNPRTQIIGTSYGAELASKMNRSIQRIMDNDVYKDIYPLTRLHDANVRTMNKPLRNSDVFETTGFYGSYRSAGVNGTITGTGANILLIDDPIKNQKEADSLTYRDGVWDWYTSTAYTRLEKDGAVILVMTRWHEDDLAGRLLDEAKKNPSADQWDVLSLEAVRETMDNQIDIRELGDPLWPWKYNTERLNAMKSTVGSRVWNALYQQRPTALDGGILKREWMKNFYRELPARFDTIIQSWDAAFTKSETSDFVVGQVWGRLGGSYYLIDQRRDRMSYTDTKQAIKLMSGKHPKTYRKIVEKKANGDALIDDLKKDVSGIVGYTPKESKVSRANAVSPKFEAGNVFLPDPSIAPWISDYIDELTSFPNGTNDDMVDATTQALIHLSENGDWITALTK